MDLLERRRAALRHGPANLRGSGERDHAHIVAADQGIADLAAAAGHEVHHARGDAGFGENPDEVQRRQRRQRRRFEDDGVAADQRRNDLPRGDGHRKVPRRNHGTDPERLPHRHREFVTELGRHRLTILAAAFSRHEERHVDRFLNVAARLVEHLSHLTRHVPGQRVLAIGNQLRRPKEDFGTAGSRNEAPQLERAPRGVNRPRDVRRRRLLEHPEEIAGVRRVAVLETVA